MSQRFIELFKPGHIGKMEVRNRIVKAPTWTLLGARDGSVTERIIRHYSELARGGTGLVIVEFSYVDNIASQSGVCQLAIYDNAFVPGLAQLAQGIKAYGARAALQISHCGRQRRLGIPPIKAASAIPSEDFELKGKFVPEALTIQEIEEIVKAFGDAARRAQVAGFDMVEVHGAHGYLPSGFLSPRSNKRTDKYGGSLGNRMRFLLELTADMRRKVGPDYPIGIRLNGTDFLPGGIVIEETIQVAKALEKLGVNVLHISAGNYEARLPRESTEAIPFGPLVFLAEAVKKEVNIPIIASGSLHMPEVAEEVLRKGQADFVAMARGLLADPYWARKTKEGRVEDIIPCIRCNDGCHYRSQKQGRPIMCTVNVQLGREDELVLTPVKSPKKIAVIGGGPAGMEAARVSALRGHDVTLYEKRQLGGALIEASAPDFKPDLKRLISYYTRQLDNLKVKVVTQEATPGTIKKGRFDAVILAAGGTPIKLDVPGADKPLVVGALEVLRSKAPVGQKVMIVGGGVVGTETGIFLAEQGKEVVFVELLDEFMNGVEVLDRIVYQERLGKQKVTVHTGTRVETVLDKGAVIVDRSSRRQEIAADSIVVAIGLAPQPGLVEKFSGDGMPEVCTVGDCVRPRKIFDAIQEGYLAAFSIT
ncbi:MAG: FAD-dependent oxidoreductase [Chloroflexota bacterium]|nr:FAD-dependent oxidoreductase [Chloroflexota bacterium]